FSTDTRWQGNFLRFRDKTGGNALLASKPIHHPRHVLEKAAGLHFQGFYPLHFLSNRCDLVVENRLHTTQFLEKTGGVAGGRMSSPQEINLHFQPDERLDNSIMKLLHKAYSLLGLST